MPEIKLPNLTAPRAALFARYGKPALILLGCLACALALYFGFQRLSSWKAAKDLLHLETEIKRVERERDDYKARADENAKQIERKDVELQVANQRAEQAEANLAAASRNRQRAEASYEAIRSAPVNHSAPAPSVDDLCKRLEAVGKSCKE